MARNYHEPVKNKFQFLLSRDFGSRIILRNPIFLPIHWLQKVLSWVWLHVNITCLHSLKSDCHRSICACSFEHFWLTEERFLTLDSLGIYFFGQFFGVSSAGNSLNHRDQDHNNKSNSHLVIENVWLPSNEWFGIYCIVFKRCKNVNNHD